MERRRGCIIFMKSLKRAHKSRGKSVQGCCAIFAQDLAKIGAGTFSSSRR